jgi:hypothetical protein
MSRLINPVLFSVRFKIPAATLDKAGLIDPILNTDTKLFIDPLLLATSGNKLIKTKALPLLKKRFEEIVRLVAASASKGDVAWRTAGKLLDLRERPETGLGYGGSGTSGSTRPDSIKQ